MLTVTTSPSAGYVRAGARIEYAGRDVGADPQRFVQRSARCARDERRFFFAGHHVAGLGAGAEVLVDAEFDSYVVVGALSLALVRDAGALSVLVPAGDGPPVRLALRGVDAASFRVLSECFACDAGRVYGHTLAWLHARTDGARATLAALGELPAELATGDVPRRHTALWEELQQRCATPFDGVLYALPEIDAASVRALELPVLVADRAHVYYWTWESDSYRATVARLDGLDAASCVALERAGSERGALKDRLRDAHGTYRIGLGEPVQGSYPLEFERADPDAPGEPLPLTVLWPRSAPREARTPPDAGAQAAETGDDDLPF